MSKSDENIPLDQMMRKLKSGSGQAYSDKPEEGERVIREDGSVAIKVKTKKRRSIQPKKSTEKKSNKVKLVLLSGIAAFILLSVIGFFILLGYFNGSRFKSKVSETIVNVSGAEVELGSLDVSPTSARSSSIDLKWSGEDTLLKSLKLKKINADYGMLDFIGSGLGGGSMGVSQADLILEVGENNPRLDFSPERPVDFKFSLYQCSDLNIDFGKNSPWSFKKGSASYRASGPQNQFSLDSGDVSIPKFGKFKLQTGIVSLAANEAQVYLNLKSDEHMGSFNVEGTVGYTIGSPMELEINLSNYPLKDWIDPRARRLFNGNIHKAKGDLAMNLGDIESLSINANITTRLISIADFEFIKSISEHLQETYYIRPEFTDSSKLKVKWTKNRIEFSDIDLLQNEQMRLKGNVTINENDQLSGTLKVGIPVVVISRNKSVIFDKAFTENDGEYMWTTVVISGDIANPKDDLSKMIRETIVKDAKVNEDNDDASKRKLKELTE